jgi:hypothetical protein
MRKLNAAVKKGIASQHQCIESVIEARLLFVLDNQYPFPRNNCVQTSIYHVIIANVNVTNNYHPNETRTIMFLRYIVA